MNKKLNYVNAESVFYTNSAFFFSYPERLCLAIQSLKEVPLLFLQLHLCLFEFFLLYSMALQGREAKAAAKASLLHFYHGMKFLRLQNFQEG